MRVPCPSPGSLPKVGGTPSIFLISADFLLCPHVSTHCLKYLHLDLFPGSDLSQGRGRLFLNTLVTKGRRIVHLHLSLQPLLPNGSGHTMPVTRPRE